MNFKPGKKNIERISLLFGKPKDEVFHFDLIEQYFRGKEMGQELSNLSDRTCNDLDFNDLFAYIDRTSSKIGQQYLYYKLRSASGISKNTLQNEEIIKHLSDNPDLRVKIQLLLERLSNTEAFNLTSTFQEVYIKRPKWFIIIQMLSLISLVSLFLILFNPIFVFVTAGVFIVNIGIHYWNKKSLYPYLSSIPVLLKLLDAANELSRIELFKNINPFISESITNLERIRNKLLYFKFEANLNNDFSALLWMIAEFFKIFFLLDPLILFNVLDHLDSKRKDIESIFLFVGEIDSLISVTSLRKGLKTFCTPRIEDVENQIIANEMYHPLISHCVENSISVTGKSVLITGSNMSGKTTFIRTLGVNMITGSAINTCFAKDICFPELHVSSAIRISDDLMNDKSYYFEEVLTINKMICNSIRGKNLFLLDEIFKGTNTIERIAAGKAVLSYLSKNGNIVFVSTHDIELAELLKDEFDQYHFSESINSNSIDFDYKLKEGSLINRNAIKILKMNDYPESVISEAISLSEKLEHIYKLNRLNR